MGGARGGASLLQSPVRGEHSTCHRALEQLLLGERQRDNDLCTDLIPDCMRLGNVNRVHVCSLPDQAAWEWAYEQPTAPRLPANEWERTLTLRSQLQLVVGGYVVGEQGESQQCGSSLSEVWPGMAGWQDVPAQQFIQTCSEMNDTHLKVANHTLKECL